MVSSQNLSFWLSDTDLACILVPLGADLPLEWMAHILGSIGGNLDKEVSPLKQQN